MFYTFWCIIVWNSQSQSSIKGSKFRSLFTLSNKLSAFWNRKNKFPICIDVRKCRTRKWTCAGPILTKVTQQEHQGVIKLKLNSTFLVLAESWVEWVPYPRARAIQRSTPRRAGKCSCYSPWPPSKVVTCTYKSGAVKKRARQIAFRSTNGDDSMKRNGGAKVWQRALRAVSQRVCQKSPLMMSVAPGEKREIDAS